MRVRARSMRTGGCGHTKAIAIAHIRAHRARENSTGLGRVALAGGPVCM